MIRFSSRIRSLAKSLCAFLFISSTASTFAAGLTAKPNFVIILTDDQGLADYSAYGTRDLRTPNMDRIFHEGMTFQNFKANSPVCSPTRASLLTGCYPDRVGVPGLVREEEPGNNWGYLAHSAVLLPKLLKPAGYHTGMVGKWNLGLSSPNIPNDRGFDFYQGFLGDMMDDYWKHLRHDVNMLRKNREVITPEGHATDLFTDWACDYIAERAKSGQPFFLYLAYNAPHDPIQPPPEWLEKVRAREPGMDEKRMKLVALIEHLDAGIGRVLDTLEKAGVSQNTLVTLSSDNGGSLPVGAKNGPWRSGKTHMYEGGLRVPFGARWPARIKAGSETPRTALTMDLFPTVLEAAGAAVPKDIDGASFLPTMVGESQPETPRDLYFVRREGGPMYGGKTIEAFQRGYWKLLQDSPFGALELYNLKEDPYETTNLAEKRKDIVRDLNAGLRKQIQKSGSVPWQKPEQPDDLK
ncbi:arylsulfatase A-like enzyme [Roseimicrobium gellanilyticum]|uniref:Arylsulfatase A-like enzyme n=1 Tax=Roseimicrobium gellanilyticum TaxID=748857 RepID=A0A366HMM4_9BACT|nr:sulfatase-like hydrolase/transferase [Roseimicrobium gellanilyticum]RBP43827.1 arylsulfatase A-like enzyme [Roseimicrobium gellanilyticum]